MALAAMVAAGSCLPVRAHPGHSFANVFACSSVPEACQLAEQHHRLALLYITPPGGSAPAYLEAPTWADWMALDPLLIEAVLVKLDAALFARQGRVLSRGRACSPWRAVPLWSRPWPPQGRWSTPSC